MTQRARSAHRAVRPLGLALVITLVAAACAKPRSPTPAPPATASALPQRVVGDTMSTFNGIKYVLVRAGRGGRPRPGRTVIVHYTGTLKDGTKFDSSRDRAEPFEFVLGNHAVIAGWDDVIGLLEVGDRAICIIPPELGYGSKGSPPNIPPNATLIFDIELLGIR